MIIPTFEAQLKKKLVQFLEYKNYSLRSHTVQRYGNCIQRAIDALVAEKRRRREDPQREDNLQLLPENWGEEEIMIMIDALDRVEWSIARLKDFCRYYDNFWLEKHKVRPVQQRFKEYRWLDWDELELVREVAKKSSPAIEFAVECVLLTMRPIGVLRLKVDGICNGYFITYDKGRGKGKRRRVVWTPDTHITVTRYMKWRAEQMRIAREQYGLNPQIDRALIYRKGKKIAAYGSTPQKGRSGFDNLLNTINAEFIKRKKKPICWYDLRHTILDLMDILHKVEEVMTAEDVRSIADWEKIETVKNYRSGRMDFLIKKRAIQRFYKGKQMLKEKGLIV